MSCTESIEPRFAATAVPGQGPHLFLLHGMLSSQAQWTPNLPALARFSRPVTFDWWGHGSSPCPLERHAYELDCLIAQIDASRIEHRAQQLLLCGQSFGAGLMIRYALKHPDLVDALIITNTMSALSRPEAFGTMEQRRQRAAAIEAGGVEAVRRLPFHPQHATRLPSDIKQLLIQAADRVDPRAFARLSTIAAPALSVADALHELRVPTLLVNGRWEKAFQPLRDLAAREIPDCEVVDVDAGHAVNLENAPAFDEAVERFVDRVLTRSPRRPAA